MREGDSIGGMLPDGIDRSKTQEFMNTELLRERVLSIGMHVAKRESNEISKEINLRRL